MIKKHYIDAMVEATSEERFVAMIDKTLNFEKNAKNRNIKANLLKMISAAAALALFIGFLNMTPLFWNIGFGSAENTEGPKSSGDVHSFAAAAQSDLFLPVPKTIDPAYAHVRFGDTENILLLDIEWHTYDTYMEEVVNPLNAWYYEYIESDNYKERPEEEKERVKNSHIENDEAFNKQANEIKEHTFYQSRLTNGKPKEYTDCFASNEICVGEDGKTIDIYEYLDPDGYYIFKVFPIMCRVINYNDENGVYHNKFFDGGTNNTVCPVWIDSQSSYEQVLKNKIIPFCDDLLARGLITQAQYDEYTVPDLLDFYINLFF